MYVCRDQLRLCCANVQSLRNMSADFLCYACTVKTDIFAVTENWFSQHDICHRIKESPPRFKMMNHSRVGRTSGGTALLINYSPFWFQKVDGGDKVSFECWEWIVDCRSCKLMILIIYTKPDSFKDPVTTASLSEKFTTYLESFIMSPEPLLITGDFNIHIVVPSDIKHTRRLG